MRVLIVVCALLLAAVVSGCDKNSISSPCFSESIGSGFGSSCRSDR
jgi:hypothetical protein